MVLAKCMSWNCTYMFALPIYHFGWDGYYGHFIKEFLVSNHGLVVIVNVSCKFQ